MMDPKKLMERLPRFDKDKPFRYLGRRVVQAMADGATANLVLGQRTAPGRYLVVRVVDGSTEKERWETQWSESRGALVKELEREAAAREIGLRSTLEVELFVLTDREVEAGEAERVLTTVLDGEEVAAALVRLTDEREVILPRRVRTLLLETEPPEAQAYLDHRPVGVTPCRVEDVPDGEHVVTFSRPGFLPLEETYRVEPGRAGQKLKYRGVLRPEPRMGVLEIRTFPPRARVSVRPLATVEEGGPPAPSGETRESPARWRLPAGAVEVRVELPDFEPQNMVVELPPSGEERPHVVQLRLVYNGLARDEVVGRLVVYKPGSYAPHRSEGETSASRISAFFQDPQAPTPEEGRPESAAGRPEDPPQVLGERPLRRGVLLIGREDPAGGLVPDIRLFDPDNSVTRGCHAWIYIYADRSTGADYNTFLVGNNSPTGIRVDGGLVMETRRLADDSEIEVGNFRMRLLKETPEARVEFGF